MHINDSNSQDFNMHDWSSNVHHKSFEGLPILFPCPKDWGKKKWFKSLHCLEDFLIACLPKFVRGRWFLPHLCRILCFHKPSSVSHSSCLKKTYFSKKGCQWHLRKDNFFFFFIEWYYSWKDILASLVSTWRRKWQHTQVFLPGESQGWGSWWAAVYGVTQSQTRLRQLNSRSQPTKFQ